MTKLGATPMPLEAREQLEKLLIEYAKTDSEVAHAIGRRHNAMHAVTEWAEKHARDRVAEENARLLPSYDDPPTAESAPRLLNTAEFAESCVTAAVKGAWVCPATDACERPMGHAGDCIP